MSNYLCYDHEGKIKKGDNRFASVKLSEDVIGVNLWERSFNRGMPISEVRGFESFIEDKSRFLRRFKIKRVFISHRQNDKDKALEIADFLEKHGINYWVDALDPELSNSGNTAVQIANIIELALLNCSHVLVLMTNNSYGSNWIPYEYGRVKERSLKVKNAIAYTHRLSRSLPEYMELGVVINDESKILKVLD